MNPSPSNACNSRKALGDHQIIRLALGYLVRYAAAKGNYEEAASRSEALVTMLHRDRFVGVGAFAYADFAGALTQLGQIDRALPAIREAADIEARVGSVWTMLDSLALLAFKRGRIKEAALVTKFKKPRADPNRERVRDQLVAALRKAMPAAALKAAMAEGAELGDEQAAKLALDE